MAISTIGESYEYFYNTSTGKLESTTGEYDAFVEYFNGNLSQEELKDTKLNGFDAKRKVDIEKIFNLFCGAKTGKIYEKISNGESFTISEKIIDGATSEYYLDGEKIFTAYVAVPFTSSEEKMMFHSSQLSYETRGLSPYDAETNSIKIGVGASFYLGNGYKLTVKEDTVEGEIYGNKNVADEKLNALTKGLNALIHFADQQWMAATIFDQYMPMMLEFLRQLGIDTSREFTINETTCELVNGRIREVGNKGVVPSTVYEAALKRCEEEMYKPLSERYTS